MKEPLSGKLARRISLRQLRIAIVTTARYFAPGLLGKFCQLYPGINVFLEVTTGSSSLSTRSEILMIYTSSANDRILPSWSSGLTCRILWL